MCEKLPLKTKPRVTPWLHQHQPISVSRTLVSPRNIQDIMLNAQPTEMIRAHVRSCTR